MPLKLAPPSRIFQTTTISSNTKKFSFKCTQTVYISWGKPERAPPRAVQQLHCLFHNNNNCHPPNVHAQSLCDCSFKVQRSSIPHVRIRMYLHQISLQVTVLGMDPEERRQASLSRRRECERDRHASETAEERKSRLTR